MTGDIYQHFKGKFYRECGNSNLDGQDVIIYKKLYDDFSYWIRPVSMFKDYKEINGQKIERFKKVQTDNSSSDLKNFDQALWEKHRKTFDKPFRLFQLGFFFTVIFITLEYYGQLNNKTTLIILNVLPIILYIIDLILFKKSVNKDLSERIKNNNFYKTDKNIKTKVLYQFPAVHSETEETYIVTVNAEGKTILFRANEWNDFKKTKVKGKYLTTTGFNVIMLQLSLLIFHLLSNLQLGELTILRYIALAFGFHALYQFKKNILS